jgi:hypothetical protein
MLKKCFRDAFIGSLIFYIVSNFFVFILFDMYPKSFYGFMQCYVFALPFFVNRLSLYIFVGSCVLRTILQAVSCDFRVAFMKTYRV